MKTLAIVLAIVTPLMVVRLAHGGLDDGPLLEERRSFYASGKVHEVRHFRDGKEEGMQQAYTEDGQLYINYEMRGGRRYGYINARPCTPVKEQK